MKSRSGLRMALLAATGLTLTGCADSSRFMGDPLGNPFSSNERVDRAPTGSVPEPRRAAQERIVGQPLAAPAAAPAPSAQPAQSGPVVSSNNWTSQGGTPVVMAQGETVNVLADRYGVPLDALVRTNGYSSASQIQPGARLTIPVYSVNAAKSSPAPVRPVPQAEPKHETLKLVKGPQPARLSRDEKSDMPGAKGGARAKLLERAKTSRAKVEDEDDKPVVKPKASPPVKQAIVREDVKPAAPAPKIAPAAPKTARVEDKKAVDSAPTASLPAVEAPKADKAAETSGPEFRWPARGRVIQGFKAGGNDGINIAVPEGTAIKAAEDGVVAYAGSELKGYGNLVLIRHPNGFVSAYANNGSLDVKRGDAVKRGQTIAKSGQSGNVSSPQLHFELRKGAQPVDPSNYLASGG